MAIGTTAALILGGASLASAGIGAYGASQAAKSQTSAAEQASGTTLQATRESIAAQERQFDKSLAVQAPWLQAGKEALGTLQEKVMTGPGEFETSPGYEFRKAEGEKAIERSAAARGGLLSGATGKALTRFGQDYATQDYDNFLRRYYESLTPLQSLAGVGQSTAAQTAGASRNLGTNIGNALLQSGAQVSQNQLTAGQAQAAGQINTANVITGNIGSGINNYLMWKYMNPTPAVAKGGIE